MRSRKIGQKSFDGIEIVRTHAVQDLLSERVEPTRTDTDGAWREHSVIGEVLGHYTAYATVTNFINAAAVMFIGSADWMYRNLSRRVEVLVPIKDPRLKQFLKDTVLNSYLKDNINERELRADGSYVRVKPVEGEKRFDCQMEFEGKGLNIVSETPVHLH